MGITIPTDIMSDFRSTRKLMRLSEVEYRYLRYGTFTDGYIERENQKRTDKVEKQIEDRVELLPDRFEMLFEDIELLYQGRFKSDKDGGDVQGDEPEPNDYPKPAEGSLYSPLDTESGFNAWLMLLGLDDHSTKQEVIDALTYSEAGSESASADFGAKLGLMAYRIMGKPEPEHVEYDDIVADLIWGFMKGLCFDGLKSGDLTPELVEETSIEMIERIEQRTELAVENKRSQLETQNSEVARYLFRSPWRDVKDEMANRVNDLLSNQGITTGRQLNLKNQKTLPVNAEDDDVKLCYAVVDHLIDHHIDSDSRMGTEGHLRDFKDKYGPLEEFEIDAVVTEDLINHLLEEKRLREQIQLINFIERDIERLRKKRYRGVEAYDVFKEIAETNGQLTSSMIGSRLSTYQGSITRVAKDLAGLDCESREQSEVWIDKPLLKGDSGGWETTNYGKAVHNRIKEQEGPWNGLLDMTPNSSSVLLDAIDEIGASQLREYSSK